ncbi:hypothetical protein [Chryseobacterium sp.]|uniref:hypothetical protein n=1 Tax=Chryseobacterium sp. TaxID=1871047 RepID=UPI0011C98C11|nr:hypothetical protein [Chryseobacterium sp.]TXF79223.1 hypothetical protein FUA25_02175 [Chryseobacterium sp.]
MKIVYQILFLVFIISSCESKGQNNLPMNIEIKKENANPAAQKIMSDEFFYDVVDEFAPFGNDVGNDTFYTFIEWKNKNETKKATEFLTGNLAEMGLSDFNLNADAKDPRQLLLNVDKMPNKYDDINSIDNTVISLAFTQLFIGGNIDPEIKHLAKIAIEREVLFADVWEENSKMRLEKLAKLTDALNIAE